MTISPQETRAEDRREPRANDESLQRWEGPKATTRRTNFARWREILYMLVLRDLKARTKQAYLGYLWILIQPLLLTGVFSFLIQQVLGRTDHGVRQRASHHLDIELGGGVHVRLTGDVDVLLHRRELELDMLAIEQALRRRVLCKPVEHALVSAAGDARRDRADRRP